LVTMGSVEEAARLPVPGTEPMGLAFDDGTIWVASREAHRIYAMNPTSAAVIREIEVPGAPFGIAFVRGELHAVVGHGEDDDDRYIYRFTSAGGVEAPRIACPDLSGAHLAFDGETLFLSQAHNKKILALDAQGAVVRSIPLDRVPVGMTIVNRQFFLITRDVDSKDLQLGRLDPMDTAKGVVPLASIPFVARGLSFDGERLWMADREANEVVKLDAPRPN
jgi:hypothetical protein